MEQAEIDALLAAHGGRAQIVASLHLLRAPDIGAPAQAFLSEHEAELATIDLQRWLSRASEAQKPAALAAMAHLAERDPGRYEHEIRRAMPAELAAVASHLTTAGPPLAKPLTVPLAPDEGLFDPSEILQDLDFDSPGPAAPEAAADTRAPGITAAAGAPFEGFDDLFADGDLAGGDVSARGAGAEEGFFADGSPGGSSGDPLFGARQPILDSLVAALAAATGARARAAWKKKALAAAADTAESWAAAVLHLPPALRDAVLVRASVSPRSEERAALLEWLFQNGARRPKLVDLTLALLSMGADAARVGSWLAESWIPKLLPDKAAWSKHGVSLLVALVGSGHFSALDELFTAVLPAAAPKADSASPPWMSAVLVALTRALVRVAEEALAAGRRKEALGAAAALASLRPPSRELPAVRALRRKRAAKGEVATLLGLAERRARRPKEAPHLEDFIATVHVLSDALS